MSSPSKPEYGGQYPNRNFPPRFGSLEEIVADMAREHLADPLFTKPARERPDAAQNDGLINTWAEGDRWLWKLARELHRYDLRERKVPEHRRAARNLAKAIVEGRARWPDALLAWKRFTELSFYRLRYSRTEYALDVERSFPPWLQEKNLTPPMRERERGRIAEVKADITAWRREWEATP